MNMGMQPDVRFDDRNDRYDVASIIRHQNKMYKQDAYDPQSEENHDYRRKGRMSRLKSSKRRNKLLKEIKEAQNYQINRVVNDALLKIKSMRRDFAYHDEMISDGVDTKEYELNLKKFKSGTEENAGKDNVNILNNSVSDLRRKGSSGEVLMHYSFPINVRIKGFLQQPS
ncbi:unnamed protein product [Leptidea sinapis]|uniref:Uncharacterized protein n=2 Tax=Leptidea sinapis TaxID=189913 RepID=A0A5E4QHS4_9NEOP|nr:unnamed protein product [Leptidea sinapis]